MLQYFATLKNPTQSRAKATALFRHWVFKPEKPYKGRVGLKLLTAPNRGSQFPEIKTRNQKLI